MMNDSELWDKAEELAKQEYEQDCGSWEEADKYERQDYVFAAYMNLKENINNGTKDF